MNEHNIFASRDDPLHDESNTRGVGAHRKGASSGSDPFGAPFTIETDVRDYSTSNEPSPSHGNVFESEAAMHALLNKSDSFLADSSSFLGQTAGQQPNSDEFASFFSA